MSRLRSDMSKARSEKSLDIEIMHFKTNEKNPGSDSKAEFWQKSFFSAVMSCSFRKSAKLFNSDHDGLST